MGRHLSYTRLGRRWRRMKVFRLSSGRLPVLRLRIRLFAFFGLLGRCIQSLGRGSKRPKKWRCDFRSGSRRGLVSSAADGRQPECKVRSCARSNSFYAEAIADCLEFIKRSSVSVDDAARPPAPAGGVGEGSVGGFGVVG